jgi:hypothetical protein
MATDEALGTGLLRNLITTRIYSIVLVAKDNYVGLEVTASLE